MDGSLVHLVNDPCTPASMASAQVPLSLALWYHMRGSRMDHYSEDEIRQVLAVRAMVRQASA